MKLEKQYISEVENYIKFLKTKGFIINENNEIFHYTINDGFIKHDNFLQFVNNKVINFYGFDSAEIIYDLARAIFPEITQKQINDYKTYLELDKKIVSDKEMKKELEEIINTTKAMINNNPNLKNKDDPYLQVNVLNKLGVVYEPAPSKNRGYFMFSKSEKKFIKLDYIDIGKLLESNLDFKLKNRLSISSFMRNEYKNMILNSDFPTRWNENRVNIEKIETMKKNHNKVKKIVKSCV